MKKFLRGRKNSQTQESKPVVSAPAPLARPPAASPPETPLYSRFASATRSLDAPQPIVSEPAGLSSKTSFSRISTYSGGRGVGGQERQQKVLSRMPSRQDQVQSKPTVLSNPPTRSSSRIAPPPVSKTEPVPMPAPVAGTAFPRFSSYNESPRGPTLYAQPPGMDQSTSRTYLPASRPRTDSSGSESYAPPPRPLVVRNGDPETLSMTSLSESIPSKAPSPPSSSPLPVSPATQYARLYQTGFALHDPGVPHAPASRPPTQQPARPNAAGASRTRYPTAEPSSSASYTPSRPAYPQPEQQNAQDGPGTFTTSQQPPQRATSLLSTPSVTRRKYSPLAAFGLPVVATTSVATSSSMQTEPAQSDATHGSSAGLSGYLPTPDTTPQEVSQPTFASPEHAPAQLSVPQYRDSYARSSERLNHTPPPSPPRSIPHIPSIQDLGGPQRTSTYRTSDYLPPLPTNAVGNFDEGLPAQASYSTPVPQVPDMGRGYTPDDGQRVAVVPLDDRPPTPPTKRGHFGTRHFVTVSEDQPPPPPPSKSPESRSMPDRLRPQADRNSRERSSPDRRTPPVQPGPIRGKPLIFAAMTSGADMEDMEPEAVEIIEDPALQARDSRRFSSFLAEHRQQMSTPPPEPVPEPPRDPSPTKRQSSKLQKRSSRKAVPPVDEPSEWHAAAQVPPPSSERQGSSRHQSKRESVSVDPRVQQQETHYRQESRVDSETAREHRRRGSSHDSTKLQKRPRDAVKTLTERQMEKLNSGKPYPGAHVPRDYGEREQQARRSYAEEQPSARPPMPQHTSHRSSQAYATPSQIPTSHRRSMVPDKPLPQPGRPQPPPQMSSSQWPEQHSKRHSPQLPTPPEECSPIPEPNRETSPRKAKRISPQHIEDMEVFAGKPRSSRPRSTTPDEPQPYPLLAHLSDPVLLEGLLAHLSYYEWLRLAAASKEIRRTLYEDGREPVLSRYLQTVGYSKWSWDTPEPLILSVEDLTHYMRGVSIPTHSYAAIAENWLRNKASVEALTMQQLTFACRAFTRVVLRLRAQAEAEAAHIARLAASMPPSPTSSGAPRMRTLSSASQRLPAKWASQTSLNSRPGSRAPSPHGRGASPPQLRKTFHSPLFRLRRAPLLQVFVPSPEGDWLSDASVLECEVELKRAGVLHLLRAGDVIWDIAAGDEANAGRLVWDGSYLIDLDYTYSKVGDPPKYLPTLAFPPSYFHRVIRTMGTGNPIVRIDLSPWSDDVKANVQLLQDKMRTDTPQGGRHTVIRWMYRSSFVIRPPPGSRSIRLPLPHPSGPGPSPAGAWIVDPDWFGTVVVETEGTNEGLADLHDRLKGPIVPNRRGYQLSPEQTLVNERRTVFRILREKSRPGEIWIRVVSDKERIIPL